MRKALLRLCSSHQASYCSLFWIRTFLVPYLYTPSILTTTCCSSTIALATAASVCRISIVYTSKIALHYGSNPDITILIAIQPSSPTISPTFRFSTATTAVRTTEIHTLICLFRTPEGACSLWCGEGDGGSSRRNASLLYQKAILLKGVCAPATGVGCL